MELWKREYICPCGGHIVDPWELGFDSDGAWLICDNEDRGDGSPCERYVYEGDVWKHLRPNPLKRFWLKLFPKPKIYNVLSEDFSINALKITGIHWDMSRLENGSEQCCVVGCYNSRLWGHWTCETHRELELKYFDPVGEDGKLFYSHIGKCYPRPEKPCPDSVKSPSHNQKIYK